MQHSKKDAVEQFSSNFIRTLKDIRWKFGKLSSPLLALKPIVNGDQVINPTPSMQPVKKYVYIYMYVETCIIFFSFFFYYFLTSLSD